MKIFKSFFLIALMAISFSLHANDEKPASKFKLATEVVNHHAIVYQLSNLQQMNTRVRITSIDRTTTYFQKQVKKHNGFREKINMEQLADGRYIFEVNQDNATKCQIILIRDGKLAVSNISN